MPRLLALALVLLALVGALALWQLSRAPRPVSATLSVSEALGSVDTVGYARAWAPRPFAFPADHGPHPDFRTEWWYVTGNVATATGRPFGFQFTLFRQALAPAQPTRASSWATRQVMLGHLALSDITAGRFTAGERLVRAAGGLGGAEAAPYRIWAEGWQLSPARADQSGFWPLRLVGSHDGVALELVLDSLKPLVLQGERGLSHKSTQPGNASYYYSYPRLSVSGRITTADGAHAVSGQAWFDREWSTSALAPDQVGWDWFSLQLDDQTELMLYQLRRRDGSADPTSSGSAVAPDGGSARLALGDFTLAVTEHWTHPRSGIRYPSRWQISVPSQGLELTVTPRLADQELPLQVRYWEGSVSVSGTRRGRPVTGLGYVELTGYTAER